MNKKIKYQQNYLFTAGFIHLDNKAKWGVNLNPWSKHQLLSTYDYNTALYMHTEPADLALEYVEHWTAILGGV